jgi:general secretion pathway protein M
MMKSLNAAQSRFAAGALLLVLMFALAAAIAIPVWWLNQRYDTVLSDAQSRLARYLRIAGMRPALQAQVKQVGELNGASHFLRATSVPLAAAEIQELAKKVVESRNGKLNSMQILEPKEEGLYRRVTVNIQLTATLSSLKDILHDLEGSRPYLFIDNFSARAAPIFVRPGGTPPAETDLVIQFDLSGYALKGGAS